MVRDDRESGLLSGDPRFEVSIIDDQPTYQENPTTEQTAPPGVYSPASHLWMPPNLPVPVPRPADPLPPLPQDFENPQRSRHLTFARVRTFPKSFRRVQVIVNYGGGTKVYRLVSWVIRSLRFNLRSPSRVLISRPGRGGRLYRGCSGTRVGRSLRTSVCGESIRWEREPSLSSQSTATDAGHGSGDPNAQSGTTRLAVRLRYRGLNLRGFPTQFR